MELILQPFSDRVLGELLRAALRGNVGAFDSFQAAVAFVKRSGTQHIVAELTEFVDRGGRVRIVAGVDQHGTSIEGLSDLLTALDGRGELWIHHSERTYVTFHPKIYLFVGPDLALAIIGSGNLTQGGLYGNDEAFAILSLDLGKTDDVRVMQELEMAFNRWCETQANTAHLVDSDFLKALIDDDYIRPEAQTRAEGDAGVATTEKDSEAKDEESTTLFGLGPARHRPSKQRTSKTKSFQPPPAEAHSLGFVMVLMKTDVGFGQTTPGTSRRSPEIFIPLSARNAEPGFWGWPDNFAEDSDRSGKFDRLNVQMRLAGEVIVVNMMTWPVKHDFRLRSEALRSAGDIGDILRVEQAPKGTGYEYHVEIIPKGTSEYDRYSELCVQSVPNSQKRWGYYTY